MKQLNTDNYDMKSVANESKRKIYKTAHNIKYKKSLSIYFTKKIIQIFKNFPLYLYRVSVKYYEWIIFTNLII